MGKCIAHRMSRRLSHKTVHVNLLLAPLQNKQQPQNPTPLVPQITITNNECSCHPAIKLENGRELDGKEEAFLLGCAKAVLQELLNERQLQSKIAESLGTNEFNQSL